MGLTSRAFLVVDLSRGHALDSRIGNVALRDLAHVSIGSIEDYESARDEHVRRRD